jgi:hypothetical protein
MAYGQDLFGQQPYGGTGFDGTGPSLVSTDPAPSERNVVLDAPVTVVLTSPDGLDPWLLAVSLEGGQAIVGGAFRPGYGGTITFDGNDCTIVISTHPDFTDSVWVSLQIWATDLAAVSGSWVVDFYAVQLTIVGETVAESESAATQQDGQLPLSETASVSENLALVHTGAEDLPETVAVSEAASGIHGIPQGVSDTISASEALASQQDGQAPVSEAASLVEGLTAVRGTEALVGDTVSVSDVVAAPVGAHPFVADTVTTSDAAGLLQGKQVPAPETISVTDAAAAVRNTLVDATETAVLVEGSAVVAGFVTGDLADTVPVSDSEDTTYGAHAVLSDAALTIIENLDVLVRVILYETIPVDDDVVALFRLAVARTETVLISENVTPSTDDNREVSETVLVSDAATGISRACPHVSETVVVEESLTVGIAGINPYGQQIRVRFDYLMDLEGLLDPANWNILNLRGAYPVAIESIEPISDVLQQGIQCAVVSSSEAQSELVLGDAIQPVTLDSYILIDGSYRRVLSVTPVIVQGALPPYAQVNWSEVTFGGVILHVTRGQDDRNYQLSVRGLKKTTGEPVALVQEYTAVVPKPRLLGVSFFDEGQVLLTFSETMRPDPDLSSVSEYSITGPTAVEVQGIRTVGPNQIMLLTHGMAAGSYTLEVNAAGTPKDAAGNPIDPVYNTAAFTAALPLSIRSIFTDHGPISKPPLTLQAGATGYISTFAEVALPTVSLVPDLVGKYLTLDGSMTSGTYRITAIIPASGLQPPKVRVQASFSLPNTDVLNWTIFDPRDGQIADDPADVVVQVNSLPVTPEAVLGLLGQVVLPTRPPAGSDVRVDYSFVLNPEVEIRRLNSKEFHLNNWNRDLNRPADASQHKYRFNNVLTTPAMYVTDDLQADLPEPLQRDLKYRAYERAYTALLNDPNLLTLNSPNHRIAFPPLERAVSSTFVSYDALALPEASSPPWERVGSGTAIIDNGELVVQDTTGGPFPGGEPVFWYRKEETSFPHVLAATWRMRVTADPVTEGVFTGVCVGYSGEFRAFILGCLDVGGVKKLGILKRGYGNDPSSVDGWTGGLDSTLNPTGLPTDFDWSIEHSYRFFRASDGLVKVYVDGEVVETLRVLEDELPFLEELNAPFDTLEGLWFGSLSRPAENTSRWTFFRYLVLPINPYQVAPSVFVSYEGTTPPEDSSEPWTPIGYHGTETIVSGNLVLDSTSATDVPTSAMAGLVGGDFRGYMKLEPLLSASTDNVLDVNVQLRTWTHGITNNAVTAAIDDGERLIQLCFFPDKGVPKFSYGGRSFPDEWTPLPWTEVIVSNATAAMLGRTLQITNPDVTSGLVYYIDDTFPSTSDERVAASNTEYVLEFRLQMQSYTPDPAGYCGAQATAFDGTRSVGLMLEEISGVRYVTLHAEGVPVAGGRFAFDWFDGEAHTFRVTKRASGIVTMVSVFVDTVYLGAVDYTTIVPQPPPSTIGTISFGSATPASLMGISTVDWFYCNIWRVLASCRKYVGIWNGRETDSLLGYHLPLKASGSGSSSGLTMSVAPLPASVVPGDLLVIDEGVNKGVYEIASITLSRTVVGVTTPFPSGPVVSNYRIAQEVDWTAAHKYRVLKNPGGMITLMLDSDPVPLIQVDYNQINIPHRSAGIFRGIANNLPSVSFGTFDPENLSQTAWDFVRFGITRSPTELRIVPHHEILNQRNVMASYEHVTTDIPHTHTDYWSSSTGIPPKKDPDFLRNSGLMAYTLLNAGTPLVPKTQTAETRTNSTPQPLGIITPSINTDGERLEINPPPPMPPPPPNHPLPPIGRLLVGLLPTVTEFALVPVLDFLGGDPASGYVQINPAGELKWAAVDIPLHLGETVYFQPQYGGDLYPIQETVSGLNRPEDVLNSDRDFVLNDGAFRWKLHVPDDVLYNCLDVIETQTGSEMIFPFDDEGQPNIGTIYYQNQYCLRYEGDHLPELDPNAGTPWVFEADDPTHVQRSIFSSILTYGTDGVGTRTIYRNATALPDSPSLQTEAQFRLRLANDTSGGLGDTQVRFGMSAPGYTMALAFVTAPTGKRYVLVKDLNSGFTVGGIPFDFLDGLFHTYRIVRDIGAASVQVFIDS